MKTFWLSVKGAALGTALVAGAAGTAQALTTVTPEYLARSYQPDLIRQAVADDGLVVDIHGGTGANVQTLADRTRTALRSSRLGRVMPLRPATGDAAAPSTKLVVIFDPATRTGYADACDARGPAAGAAVGKVMLTLCHDGEPVSSVTAQNTGATAVETSAFSDMLRRAATTLFPRRGGDLTGQGFWNTGMRN